MQESGTAEYRLDTMFRERMHIIADLPKEFDAVITCSRWRKE